jgi:hypothetical protein
MDRETAVRREYNELVVAICVVRHQIEALPDLAGAADPYRQTREQLYSWLVDLERHLAALPPRAREPADVPAVATTEVIADEPILATASRSAQ